MSAQASSAAAPAAEWSSRQSPSLGGFNLTILRLEIRRVLRNRRTMLMTIVLPIFFFLIFGVIQQYDNSRIAHGNVSAFIMVSMALYGGVLACTSGGAMVSIERSQGWSRQLRITPLSPVAYVVIKMLTALVLGAAAVAAVYVVGVISGKPSMAAYLWIVTGLSVWVGSLVFAAFGLFMGYLLPTENVMQILGFGLVLLSFAAGLFIPLSQFPQGFRDFAQYTPLYGLNQLVHAPLIGSSVHLTWVVNAVVWLVIFAAGAIWRFRKDTARI
jgi:ABC-2 type transport system permease protein